MRHPTSFVAFVAAALLGGRPLAAGDRGPAWVRHTIYDLGELVDLDGDDDLDALTCEERDNLGVVWYENPTRR